MQSALHSIQHYCSNNILPNFFFKTNDQKFNSFLWKVQEGSSGKFKVSWKELCTPKREGDLTLKRIEDWSKVGEVSVLKHIWHLWVTWGALKFAKR